LKLGYNFLRAGVEFDASYIEQVAAELQAQGSVHMPAGVLHCPCDNQSSCD